MGRVADVLHISFSVKPEWFPSQYLDPSLIEVETTTSRQVAQTEGWAEIIDRMKEIVQYELAPAHIMKYQQKLNEAVPVLDYTVDNATANSMSKAVQLDLTAGARMGTARARADLSCALPSLSTIHSQVPKPTQTPVQAPLAPSTPRKPPQTPVQVPSTPTVPSLLAKHARPNLPGVAQLGVPSTPKRQKSPAVRQR